MFYLLVVDTCLPQEEFERLNFNALEGSIPWMPSNSCVGLITFGNEIKVSLLA